jgi:hypothetical protein
MEVSLLDYTAGRLEKARMSADSCSRDLEFPNRLICGLHLLFKHLQAKLLNLGSGGSAVLLHLKKA